MTTSFDAVLEALRGADSLLVTSHVSPDGDSIGSALAMYDLLAALGKKDVAIAMQDPVPERYRWLPGADRITASPPDERSGETLVIVDAAELSRIGTIGDERAESSRIIVVDHHLVEHSDGDVAFVDASYAATGEILVFLFERAGIDITRDTATCLYVALTTDTGSFRYPLTSERSHVAASKLLRAGIDVADISTRVFDSMSYSKFRITNETLSRAVFSMDGRVAHATVTLSDLEVTGASGDDLDGINTAMRNIDGVVVSVLLKEVSPAVTKVSLRARPGFNCAAALKALGGGGHAGAAGVTLDLPLGEARDRVMQHLHTLVEASA